MHLAKPDKNQLIITGLLISGLLLAVWIYHTGLNSLFVLDDEPNLQSLVKIQNEPGLESTLFFISQGASGITGRPIASLSFALQYNSWPSDPYAFKYVNLMIHLLIACLIYLFISQLMVILNYKSGFYKLLPVLTTIFWLLHPLQVTTVLYTVQRMAQLSALFTLLGLLFYIKGRMSLIAGQTLKAYALALGGIVLCGSLAVLSKENGVLLLLYILLLEITVFIKQPRTRGWNILLLLMLLIPLGLGILYFLINFQSLILAGYAEKPFTLSERLMTEARVLMQYLTNLFVIRPNIYGLYHDNITLSTSLINPITTLTAISALIVIAFSAIKLRKAYPLAAFAILWFFVAHSLESTVFPLELYFEHRNYLAIIGPIIVFLLGLNFLFHKIPGTLVKPALIVATALWALMLTTITRQEADLWSQPRLQAKIWSQENPDSVRAQLASAVIWATENRPDKVRTIFNAVLKQFPENTGILVSLVGFSCIDTNFSPEPVEKLIARMKTATRNYGFVHLADNAIRLKEQKQCPAVSHRDFFEMLTVLLENPALKQKKAYVHLLRGRTNLMLGHLLSALNDFEASFKINPSIASALYLTQTCELLQNYSCAMRAINKADTVSRKRFWDKLAYQKIISQIKKRITYLGKRQQRGTFPLQQKNDTLIFN